MTSSRVMKYWSSGKNRKMHVLDKHQRFSGTGFGKDKTVKAKTNICKTNICRTKKRHRQVQIHKCTPATHKAGQREERRGNSH